MTEMKKRCDLLIIGSGGHARSVLDAAVATEKFNSIAFATTDCNSEPIAGYPVLDERQLDQRNIASRYGAVVVAIGDNSVRLRKTRLLLEAGANMPSIIHPSASVSSFSKIGPGTVVLSNASINSFARVGIACIVNTGAVVEHECVLEDGVHLSPCSAIGGGTHIGEKTWLCIGSCVSDHVTVSPGIVLAGGSCLVEDAIDAGLYAGVPAKLKKGCRSFSGNEYDGRGQGGGS